MRRRELIAGLVAVAIVVAPAVAASQTTPQELAVKLTPAQRQIYDDYRRAREAFEAKLRGYWGRVDAKRDARRAKHMLAQPLSTEDYVAEQPPKYAGPELPAEIAKLVVEIMPPTPARPLPEVSDFVANAKAQYGFVPAPTHGAGLQAPLRARGAGGRAQQGPSGAHLCARNRRAGHL